MRSDWIVIVNKECSIKGGDVIVCESKSKAMNIASYVARVLYNASVFEQHVFVVNRTEKVIETIDGDEFGYRVICHYSIIYYIDMGLKMLMRYDGWGANQKKIASQWMGDENK